MANVTLVPVSKSIYYIMQGKRKRFGEVRECPAGWVATYRFDKRMLKEVRPTPEEAFFAVLETRNDAFAKSAGFKNVAELDAHNYKVRQENRERRETAKRAMSEALRNSNFNPLIDILDKMK